MKLVQIPYDSGTLGANTGCSKAPSELVKTLSKLCEKRGGVVPFEIEEVPVVSGNVDVTMNNIEACEGDVFVGGDHSVTYGAVKSFKNKHDSFGLIIFDAHPDLEVSAGSVSHEDYLRSLIDEGIVDPKNVLLVGVRDVSKNEMSYIKEKGVTVFNLRKWGSEPVSELADAVTEFVNRFPAAYVSFDIDVVDPCFAPGTGHLAVGGFRSLDVLYLVQRLRRMKNLRGFDIVEVNPEKDVRNMTVELGCEILYTLLSKE
jgi:arginase family enzyme|tara:strand:- start:198 stop:971 length:774 start_codon:yes stop_codon:yes gene_type:complete